jgi:hypothetical protein
VKHECIWCGQSIDVDHAGWAYVHSVALLHFTSCDARPVNITSEDIRMMAVQVADTMEKGERES